MRTALLALLGASCWARLNGAVLVEHFCPATAPSATDQRFFVVGARDSPNHGIGNLLAFYPAMYFYAMLSGRFIVIEESSYIGQLCSVVRCGFPFYSSVRLAFPETFSALDDNQITVLNHKSFSQAFSKEGTLESDVVITAAGMDARSDWWVWQDSTRECVAKITGCIIGDVGCAERVAYQSLLVGPFVDARKASSVLPSISGMSSAMKTAILTLPRSYAPRIDVTVHLRNQFSHFEQEMDPALPDSVNEVRGWLNSSECGEVFSSMAHELTARLHALHSAPGQRPAVHVYVAADNEEVKRAFKQMLLGHRELVESTRFALHVVTIETAGIVHIKNLDKLKASSDGKGLLHLVLDFYMMSLSNLVLAWRTGGTKGFSTFVSSARKISGTRERTTLQDGRSIATRAFQLVRGKRGGYGFEELWVYGVIETH